MTFNSKKNKRNLARSHTIFNILKCIFTTWKRVKPRACPCLSRRPLKREDVWLSPQMLTRRGVRVRLEARLQAGPSTSWPRCRFYGGMQELEHFVMPDLHHEDRLRRAQMSGCRSAVDVEPTANRILTTDSSIGPHARCTHELTLTVEPQPHRPSPIPTAHR